MRKRIFALAGLLATVLPARAQHRIIDLGTLGGPTGAAYDINEAGQVVGSMDTAWYDWLEPDVTYYECHAFVWQDRVTTVIDTYGHELYRPNAGAWSINEAGRIVGEAVAEYGGKPIAFSWQDGVSSRLAGLVALGTYSGADDINEAGQVVGYVYPGGLHPCEGEESKSCRDQHAFLWQADVATDLGTFGGYSSGAAAVNDSGQVVGWAETGEGWSRAFLWENGLMTELGTLGGDESRARDINEAGQVVGAANTVETYIEWDGALRYRSHAFVWDNGVMTDLGTLGGSDSGARAINNRGQIVGWATTAEGGTHAFLWEDGVMRDLGSLPGGSGSSYAHGINDRGQIVGEAYTGGRYDGTGYSEVHAVLWNPPQVITALEASPQTGIRIFLTGLLSSSAGLYRLQTADGADGPWSAVPEATLTKLKPDHYEFTLPFGEGRATAFWRVVEATDSDGDGTSDEVDGCPDDPLKTEPGCGGCGASDDLDSDGDGTVDCLDGCPHEPLKTEAGVCGCGVVDRDTDGDAVLDCIDRCPGSDDGLDENGNGIPDGCELTWDTDGDGAPDWLDGCLLDPLKTEPGVCGCGAAETDTDGDKVADCLDGCPEDSGKTEPGHCECGLADKDRDGDTVLDCEDLCPGWDDRIDENGNHVPDCTEQSGMAWIGPGEFRMGNALSGEGNSDGLPVHTVYVRGFYMDQHEVSWALWQAVQAWALGHGYSFDNAGEGKGANHPVQMVSWYDAVKWCNARSEKEGVLYVGCADDCLPHGTIRPRQRLGEVGRQRIPPSDRG